MASSGIRAKKNEVSDGVLWVLGDGRLVGYKVKGSGQNTDLDVWREVVIDHPGARMGHDLQPDFTDSGHLLLTDSKGVYSYDVNNDKVVRKWAKERVKSIARHPTTKEYVWVVGSPDTVRWAQRTASARTWGNRLPSAAGPTRASTRPGSSAPPTSDTSDTDTTAAPGFRGNRTRVPPSGVTSVV
jgi:hypothetical protein